MHSTQILHHPESASEYRSKQAEQALYYEKIIRNIDIVLQMNQVCHIHEGLPSPRYVPSINELENDNVSFILQSVHGDADTADKETQIIHMEFIRERDCKVNHPDSLSRLQNIEDLMDMGFNITECSPIPTVRDSVPQTPVGSRTTTQVPTSTPRPSGGSRLHSSDPTSNKKHAHKGNLHNSFTAIVSQVEQQTFRNQRISTSPRETPGTQATSPVVVETSRNLPSQQNTGKGGKKKS